MKKIICFITLFFSIAQSLFSSVLMQSYSSAIEKLILFKEDRFKVFYGGPITSKNNSIQWMMIASFEDENYKTKSVYEIAFINCNLQNCDGAEVLFVSASDLDIKLKNKLTTDYEVFNDLISSKHSDKKYIVVRETDISISFYPDVFIKENFDISNLEERNIIISFLHKKFKTQATWKDSYNGSVKRRIKNDSKDEIVFFPRIVAIDFGYETYEFEVTERILKEDIWKLYYVISLPGQDSDVLVSKMPIVRIDSGCVSGQIYVDDACDCLDQLHSALYQIALKKDKRNILIHIPAHDGRGFGTAPKAETEIYKRGGKGRVHTTEPLDTVKSAKLLYNTVDFDIRTYDGAAKILDKMNLKQVELLTDNILKVNSMSKNGIEVIRKKTETQKPSCADHLKAKKNANHIYYSD